MFYAAYFKVMFYISESSIREIHVLSMFHDAVCATGNNLTN